MLSNLRHILAFCAAAVLAAACGTSEIDTTKDLDFQAPTFICRIDASESISARTYVDESLNMFWTADDCVSIFTNTYNQQYKFTGKTGENTGTFAKVKTDEPATGISLSRYYGVYPYNAATEIASDGQMTLELPAVQDYAANSFGLGANTMVAVTGNSEDNSLPFKNVCGYLVINLYGDCAIKSITLKGNNGEKIAGKALCIPAFGEAPAIAFDEAASSEITLNCGEGVELGKTEETATAFWFVVPPVTFSDGFSISCTSDAGTITEKSTSISRTVERNKVFNMAPLECDTEFHRVAVQSRVTDVQPMTGHVLWTDNDKNGSWPIQLEFSYMLYSDICREKGVYDWTPVETLLNDVASRGHQAVLRFRYTYVGEKCAVPDWIKKIDGYKETKGRSEGEVTYFPDWRCKELQDFHMEFYQKFAQRYDKDPRLAFVETGFGLWAEYHIYDGPFILGQTFPSKDFQAEFLSRMGEWWSDCTWSISIDAADDTYSPFAKQKDLLKIRFGNFDDSFMCEDHDDYNYSSWLFFGKERYKTAPFGGEFSYNSTSDQKHCLDSKGMYGRVFENEVAKYHMTFIIANDQPQYQTKSRFKESSMSMGYHFAIADALVRNHTARILIRNIGVAPIYRDAFVAVNGVRSEWSLQNLMPGGEKWVEVTDPSITSDKFDISIACDHLVQGQRIQFDADIKPEN